MTRQLEMAAVQLAAELHSWSDEHDGKQPWAMELARLEAALSTAAIENEAVADLPRMIELEKHTAPETEYNAGWNAALDVAASLARFVLPKGN